MRPRCFALSCCILCAACAPSDDERKRPRLEIIVDEHGVPHIYGATDADAFFGAGYQMATDRMFHMDQTLRRARGRLAEVHGPSAVEDDELARLFDWAGWGHRHLEAMQAENPSTLALLEAWTDGINARIDEIRRGEAPLPWGFGPEQFDYLPEDWAPVDVLTIATMTGFGNDLSFDREIFAAIAHRLYPDAVGAVQLLRPARDVFTVAHMGSQQRAPTGPEATAAMASRSEGQLELDAAALAGLQRLRRLRGIGSNNWAVAGEHTANGRPLIAGDPHLGFDLPGAFYALHIISKDQRGTIDAAGFSFVGTPGVSVGQTDRVVWTPTTAFADVMDVWTVAMPDPDHVMLGGQALSVTRREELITVRTPTSPVGDGATHSIEVLIVDGHGVILPTSLVPIPLGEPGDRLLMTWTGFRANAFPSLLDFNRVETVADFELAVDGFGGNFNFVAADANAITHRVGTPVPVRDLGEGRTPWLVLDGEDPKTLWTGQFLPAEQLPRGRGEGRGFIVTANNDPFGFTANGRVDDDPWYFGAYFAPGWRAARIEQELARLVSERSGTIDLEDMQALQHDVHSSLGDDLIPLLASAWAHVSTDPSLEAFVGRSDLGGLVELLVAWDREMKRNSPEALVLHAYAQMVTRRVLGDDMSLLFLAAMELQPVFIIKIATMAVRGIYPDGGAVLQEGRDPILLQALDDVADLLVSRFGGLEPTRWRLADARVSSFDGATGRGLHRGLHPTDGGESTVNVAADGSFFDPSGEVREQWTSAWGPIFRIVATFDDHGTPELHFNAPLGNVADPASPHFDDLMGDWLDGRYRKMPYSRAEVEAAERSRIVLLDETD